MKTPKVTRPEMRKVMDKIYIQKALSRIQNTIQDTNDLEELMQKYPCKQLQAKIRSKINFRHDMNPFVPYIETRIEVAEMIINHDCTEQDTCDCYKEENTNESPSESP